MPARRLLMRKIREVLRLRHEQGLSHREIAQSCFIGAGTVSRYLQKTAARGLRWPLPTELDDAVLEGQLFRRAAPGHDRARPDCAYIHRELKRDGVTLQLLWEEYALVHPQGYRRTQFCALYQQWARRLRPSMRQVHRAGEKTFLDFSGEAADPDRRPYGRVEARRVVRRRARGQPLHLRRGDRDPAAARLGRRSHPHGRVLRGHDHLVGPRPAQERGHAPLPLRAGRQSNLRGPRRPLRRRRDSRRGRASPATSRLFHNTSLPDCRAVSADATDSAAPRNGCTSMTAALVSGPHAGRAADGRRIEAGIISVAMCRLPAQTCLRRHPPRLERHAGAVCTWAGVCPRPEFARRAVFPVWPARARSRCRCPTGSPSPWR